MVTVGLTRTQKFNFYLGFPGDSCGKESACQCRRGWFNPWIGKISWRRKWQPTPVFLPGKSHGWRNLVGYIVHGVTKSPKRLRDFTFFFQEDQEYLDSIRDCNFQ